MLSWRRKDRHAVPPLPDARRTRTFNWSLFFEGIPSKTMRSAAALTSAESDKSTSASCSPPHPPPTNEIPAPRVMAIIAKL